MPYMWFDQWESFFKCDKERHGNLNSHQQSFVAIVKPAAKKIWRLSDKSDMNLNTFITFSIFQLFINISEQDMLPVQNPQHIHAE